MSKKALAIGLLVVGIVVIVISLGAHSLGLSASAALSWKKELLAAVGLVISLVGVGLFFWKKA